MIAVGSSRVAVFFFGVWCIGLFSCVLAQQEECEFFVFNVRFDAFPGDFALTLTENGNSNEVWSRSGYDSSYKYKVESESVCLNPSRCWRVTIFDSTTIQDGLTKTDNAGDKMGAYALLYANNVVGVYDAATSSMPCYEQHWYTFGDGCHTVADDALSQGRVGGEMCNPDLDEDLCAPFRLVSTDNGVPENARYSLQGRSETKIWDALFQRNQTGSDFIRMTCLDPTDCFRFSLYGSTEEGPGSGSFELSFNGEQIGSYSSEREEEESCFHEKWFEFGFGCPSGNTSGTENCAAAESNMTGQDGDDSCRDFRFMMFTDGFPGEISYNLTSSNGSTLWDEHPFDQSDKNNEYIKTGCLDTNDCYLFAIYDMAEAHDGLATAPIGGIAGWFRLDFDDKNVAYYNGALDGCYKSVKYSFGDACPPDAKTEVSAVQCEQREEVAEIEEEMNAGCVGFQFFVKTDEFPEDMKLRLEDVGGDMLWDDRPWSQQDVGASFDRDICLNPMGCYNFTLMDSMTHGDGLTVAPDGGVPGNFNISFGRKSIDSYDGAKDGFFSSKWYVFGDDCPPMDTTMGTVGNDRNIFTEQTSSDEVSDPLCRDFTFDIDLDEFPEDVVLSLEDHNGTTIWDDKRLWNQKHVGETFVERVCLNPQSCYTFTVEDRFSNGLTDETQHGPGGFSVTWGHRMLDSYRGEQCYSSKWYTFGDLCPFTMGTLGRTCKENIFVQQSVEECADFTFKIEVDLYPGDIEYELWKGSDEIIWEKEELGASTSRSRCLPLSECYTFTIEDKFTDGLTKGTPGKFTLDYAGERIGSYRASTDGCFSVQMFTFGDGCPSFPELIAVSEVRTSGDCRDESR